MRRRVVLLPLLVLLALALGALVLATRGSTREKAAVPLPTPSPVESPTPTPVESPTPTPSPSPSPTGGSALVLTGEIRGNPTGTVAKTCGTQTTGYYLQVAFSVGATTYQLTATIAPY